jgi:hypothetical protein
LALSKIERADGSSLDGRAIIESDDQISDVPLIGWISSMRDHGSDKVDGLDINTHERRGSENQRAADDEKTDFPS